MSWHLKTKICSSVSATALQPNTNPVSRGPALFWLSKLQLWMNATDKNSAHCSKDYSSLFDWGSIFIVAAIIFIRCEDIVIIFAEVWEHSDDPTTKSQGARNTSTRMIRQVLCSFDFKEQLQQRAPEMVMFPHCHTTKASRGARNWVTFSN